ncbi:MAG TPA: AMP-binding protein [Bryobacteraceae bacterium]|nr:AMP-binding protein [Bryobacteraceae bacterium]
MTIAGLLRERAVGPHADKLAIRFLSHGVWTEKTWGEFWAAAAAAAGSLLAFGVKPGDRVLMLVPEVEPAVIALFGLWIIGAIPIQVGQPGSVRQRPEFLANLASTAQRLGASLLITTPTIAAQQDFGSLRVFSTADLSIGAGQSLPDPNDATGTAFIQLTSGSTSQPRGVTIPHDRLMIHMQSMSECLPSHSESVAVSWLPLHHDMGLLGGLLFPFYNGFPAHMISTYDFQSRPGVWLETMSRFRATIAAAPPSAYAICVQLAPRLLRQGIDLSAWECAMIGAEPIPASLVRRFSQAFATSGFRPQAFFPVYGLAEATVAVTFPQILAPTRIDAISRTALQERGVAVRGDDMELVAVGRPISQTDVRIVDNGIDLPERHIGEILVKSASLSTGYDGQPEETAKTFRDGWLHTGDLGYLANGELFVTGRKKELIIKGGQNLIPSVLEEIVAALPGIREGAVAAVGVRSPELETEFCCIVAETRLEASEQPRLVDEIRHSLRTHGVHVDKVVLMPPKSLPKTTSGKLQRLAIAGMITERLA